VLIAIALLIFVAPIFTATAQAKKEINNMINKSTPIFHVKSVEPAVKFWTERFGFKVTVEVPEGNHIGFAALENGSVELMYQTYSRMKTDPANPLADQVEKGQSFIFMEIDDINA